MAIEAYSTRAGDPPCTPEECVNILENLDRKSCDEEHMDWDDLEHALAECHRTLSDVEARFILADPMIIERRHPKFVQITYGGGVDEKAELLALDENGNAWHYFWNDVKYRVGTPTELLRPKGWRPLSTERVTT